jgi:2-methylcitrate dehydratase PrpD
MDDLHRASVTHPGCVVVPAALAIGLQTRCSGPALLDAILRGYEAVARIGMAVGPAHYRIWHSTATCGPFGAAMAAADLLGLDDSQTVHALGNAGTQSSGLWQFIETGAMSKHLHAGRAAEAGVTAAELAALGFTGPPAILEGAKGLFAGACPDADPDAVTRDPSAPWQLRATSIKPWPSAATPIRPSMRRSSCMAGSGVCCRSRSMSRPMARRSRFATGRRRPTNTPPSSRCSIAWPWRWRTGAWDLSPSMKRPATGWRR